MKNRQFIYEEESSRLYAPDGTFLKRLFCPKAKQWNQLVIGAGETRWRGCLECKEKVFDLDNVSLQVAMDLLKNRWSKTCVHVSETSGNVIFLKDSNAVRPVKDVSGDPIKIQTVYGKADIARGYAMGYWPDVRIIRPDPKMNSKISVGQHPETGEVDYSHDYRTSFRSFGDDERSRNDGFTEVHPFVSYYPYHKPVPVAAYLIPKDLPNRTRVVVDDPIENVIGTTWNQGGGWKAEDIPGYIENKKVVLELDKVKISHAVG